MDCKAEQHKTTGNEHFKSCFLKADKNYEQSIEEYTLAIEQDVEAKPMAIYYSNRAFAHMKMENYGLAITDADAAIALNPSYPKAYYRKADACIALSQYKPA